jgi:phenylalanyl-tRNA synthetase beta chain
MLFLKSWLEDYVDLKSYSLDKIVTELSVKSYEVDEIRVINDIFDQKIIVGKITNTKKHPDADKLYVFDVLIGDGKSVRIVSAAPNVRDGIYIPLATVGAVINGLIISPRKMRGIESFGMCCGKSELNLETNTSDGLWELNQEAQFLANPEKLEEAIGQSIVKVFPNLFFPDVVLDIKILPDKIAKAGSHLAMAIELALILDAPLVNTAKKLSTTKDQDLYFEELKSNLLKTIDNDKHLLELKDPTNYTKSFMLLDLKLEADFVLSAQKRSRLNLLGVNQTNTIADLSNYLMIDLGHPSHFFSTDLLNNNQVTITNSDNCFVGLGKLNSFVDKNNEVLYTTQKTQSGQALLAIPGISGSKQSAVLSSTKDLTLEIATFDQDMVQKNCAKVGYRSDSSKLYCGVGGVDPLLSLVLLESYLKELKGIGFVLKMCNFQGQNIGLEFFLEAVVTNSHRVVKLNIDYIKSRIAKNLPLIDQDLTSIISKFGKIEDLKPDVDTNTILFSPLPIFNYIFDEEDLTREVVRIIGYDNLPKEAIVSDTTNQNSNEFNNLIAIKELVSQYGFCEIKTRPFVATEYLKLLDFDKDQLLRLEAPYKSNLEYLRPNLYLSLLEIAAKNIQDGYKDLRVFEENCAYTQNNKTLIEKYLLSGIMSTSIESSDVYVLTSLCNHLISKTVKTDIFIYQTSITSLGKSTIYKNKADDQTYCQIVEVSNKVKKIFNLPLNKRFYLFSFDLSTFDIDNYTKYGQYQDESVYPSITRSYNIEVKISDPSSNTQAIVNQVKNLANKLSINTVVTPLEIMSLPTYYKLTLSIRYTSQTKTLGVNDLFEIESYLNTIQL